MLNNRLKDGVEHGGQFFALAKLRGFSPKQALEQIIDLSASINPNQPSMSANLSLSLLRHYPPQPADNLINALTNKFQLPCENIRLTNGISAAILSIFAHLRPDNTVLYTPLYGEYQRAAARYSRNLIEIKRDIQNTDNQAWLSEKVPANSLLVFVNPATPDGFYYSPMQLAPLLKQAREHNCWLLMDESFLPFLGFSDDLSLRSLLADWPKLIIVQSLTKYYACPGLRVGAVFAHRDFLNAWPQAAWPISSLDSDLLTQALQDMHFDQHNQAWLSAAQTDLIRQLNTSALIKRCYPTRTNFVLVQTHRPAKQITQALQNANILLRPCDSFGLGDDHIRIAVHTPAVHQHLINALNNLTKESNHAVI